MTRKGLSVGRLCKQMREQMANVMDDKKRIKCWETS